MPLRDHFRSPLDDVHSWDELHGMWPAVIVQKLLPVLPEPYYAAPGVHLGTLYGVDIGPYRIPAPQPEDSQGQEGGVAMATYAPPKPTLTLEPELPDQDIYEVRIYDSRRNRHLVAAIELVSPSNKDRPENRATFVAKVATLLRNQVCVSIVDVVSTISCNLYAELLDFLHGVDPALGEEPPPMFAATLRLRHDSQRGLMDNWYHPQRIGQPLPKLPLWLNEHWAIELDLEASYEEACRTLRIP